MLAKQNGSLVDVSQDFPGIPTACVQFGTTQFVGVNAGPGQEDCLKLWVWAPAGAKKGDKLPVQVYTVSFTARTGDPDVIADLDIDSTVEVRRRAS